MREAYQYIKAAKSAFEGDDFRIISLQTEEEAIIENSLYIRQRDAPGCKRCYVAATQRLLGKKNGGLMRVHACCEYLQGAVSGEGFGLDDDVNMRVQMLEADPRKCCRLCAPTDRKFNELFELLDKAHQAGDEDIFEWFAMIGLLCYVVTHGKHTRK